MLSTPLKAVLMFCVAIGSFAAGVWWTRGGVGSGAAPGGRKILYYHDPMHPAYKSDKPGIAPDCGMQLEPVYTDGGGSDALAGPGGKDSFAPGTVRISAEKQQMIGVRLEEARKEGGAHSIRVLGRVASDEARIYKVNATVDGWIRTIEPAATTGSVVRKEQILATYNAPEFLGAMQAYLYAMGAMDRFQATGKETEAQIALTKANIQQAKNSLLVLGMSEPQAQEMAKTRTLTEDIRIIAPAAGFIVARNVSPGQRFEKGMEFFRIADLSRVWVLADLFENEARMMQPGSAATVRYQGRSFPAQVSGVPPIFDPGTRTLKVRLEVDNPSSSLRPDMFVDVDFSARMPAGVTVPADAVLDSGKRKTVFVARGDGYFEPREVETGARMNARVAISRGLEAGEKIVVAGNFLIDSESRFQFLAAGLTASAAKDAAKAAASDPVCGMEVNPTEAAGRSEYKGNTYYFCSPGCKTKFGADPEKYLPGPKSAHGSGGT